MKISTILAIESSCDDTAAAVIRDGHTILSTATASQTDLHTLYGGVVPEVSARSHIEVILPVVESALEKAEIGWDGIDAIAVTRGPGLIGSLLIGVMTAKTLALVKDKPLIGVNHIIAHAFASFLADTPPKFPILALTVSGGHSALTLYREDLSREILGETRDDAAGEAFDKVGRLLGLPYPGGPEIDKAAKSGDTHAYKFPIARLSSARGSNDGDSLDFSFSGLKTAVLRQVQELTGHNPANLDLPRTYELPTQQVANIAASFQHALVTSLVRNTVRAVEQYQPASIVVGGGVACNSYLRSEMHKSLPEAIFVPPALCTDNAAMIGALAFKMAEKGIFTTPEELSVDSSLEEL